jgi:SPP1 gp7 family putative phage head morphogenesis protein
MLRTKGISKLFLAATTLFIKDYELAALALGQAILNAQRDTRGQLETKSAAMLGPIIDAFFTSGIKATNTLFEKQVLSLVDDVVSLPFKYNKDMLLTLNKNSVFTGYYDNTTKSLFKRREIDALKRKILTAKYSGWTDRQLQAEIRKTINVTRNRALVIARNETARLETGAIDTVWQNQKRVKKEYVKVWKSLSDARPEHLALNNKVADENGMFHTSEGDIPGPPLGFNCRCKVVLERKNT